MKTPSPTEIIHAISSLRNIENLKKAVERCGGGANMVDQYLDRPLRDFIDDVAGPNGIFYQWDATATSLHEEMVPVISEVVSAMKYLNPAPDVVSE